MKPTISGEVAAAIIKRVAGGGQHEINYDLQKIVKGVYNIHCNRLAGAWVLEVYSTRLLINDTRIIIIDNDSRQMEDDIPGVFHLSDPNSIEKARERWLDIICAKEARMDFISGREQ